VLKHFIVEKEQSAPIFYFQLCSFYWWKHKIIICPGCRIPYLCHYYDMYMYKYSLYL